MDASVQEVIHIATQRSKFFSLDALELIAAKLSNIVLHRVGMLYLGSAPAQLLNMSEVSRFVIQHYVLSNSGFLWRSDSYIVCSSCCFVIY
jgi:hypothetical protein